MGEFSESYVVTAYLKTGSGTIETGPDGVEVATFDVATCDAEKAVEMANEKVGAAGWDFLHVDHLLGKDKVRLRTELIKRKGV